MEENKVHKKSFRKKWKRQSKLLRFFYIVILIAYIVGLVFFTRSILSLKAIETGIRIAALVFLFIWLLFYILGGLILLFTSKKKRFIFVLIFTTLLTSGLFVISHYIDKTYNIIDTVQKKYMTYTSVLISLNDTEEDDIEVIGMIDSKNDPTGYTIPKEIIKEKKIDAKTKKYSDYISMVNDLYDKKIDAMFVSSDFEKMFNSYEKFAKIKDEVKVIYKKSKKMENVDNISYSTKKLDEPFTILLMGVDGTGDGINNASSFNGDSLMMISFNPDTLSATIFSIPRDTYVPIACNGNKKNKINSSAYGGTSCVVKTIQNLTGIDIDYYVKINFTGVVSIVNDLGGIDVDVPMKFCEQDSERRFGQYEQCLDKGKQHLNGEQALALARHRHSLPLGDFQRVQNQQLVVEAMTQQLRNVKTTDDFYKILEDVTNNIDTNLTTPQILSLYQVIKDILVNKINDSASISIQKTFLTGYDLTMYVPGMGNVYTFQYYKNSLNDITDYMKITLGKKQPKLTKKFSFSANEKYELYVAGKGNYAKEKKIGGTVPNFIGKSRNYVANWAAARGITVYFNIVNSSTGEDGEVVSQSVPAGTVIDDLSYISIGVIQRTETTTVESTAPVESSTQTTNTNETNNSENKTSNTGDNNSSTGDSGSSSSTGDNSSISGGNNGSTGTDPGTDPGTGTTGNENTGSETVNPNVPDSPSP